jgi:hypothetical protein
LKLLLEYALGDEKSYMWAVTATSISSYALPPRAEIEGAARNLYRLLTAYQEEGSSEFAGTRRVDSLDDQYWQAASAVSQTLLGKVTSQLGHKRLLIVADGALQYLPFEALPVPAPPPAGVQLSSDASGTNNDETPVPLVWEHEIISLPSATTLASLRRRAVRPAVKADELVVVLADPVFEPDDPRLHRTDPASQAPQVEEVEAAQLRVALRGVGDGGGDPTLTRLPFTMQEAKAIMEVTPKGEGRLVTGLAASRALAIEGGLNGYHIVHLATHGVINFQHPELSGIVLSMLNQRGEHVNGFLQLHDIYGLNLSADLVVLSACSTGLGKDVRGEGLIGLTQGFLHVGAQSVVASLWRVDDRATAELMRHFYRAMFQEGLPPAAALRDAKKAMWREKRWNSPYYWAAFVLQGEYRQTIPAKSGESSGATKAFVIMILLILLLITGLLLRATKRWKVSAP